LEERRDREGKKTERGHLKIVQLDLDNTVAIANFGSTRKRGVKIDEREGKYAKNQKIKTWCLLRTDNGSGGLVWKMNLQRLKEDGRKEKQERKEYYEVNLRGGMGKKKNCEKRAGQKKKKVKKTGGKKR